MDHTMAQSIESVLSGGGEMGERMRAFDWSTTALGPLEHWPQSLRICARIILGSGYPMAICWGPDYTLLYNDAQRVLFGTKHPAALGRGTREIFPEAWESVGPLYDMVMTQGHAYTTLTDQLFPLNRHNFLEECYFVLSYSPIPDDSGHVGGVFVTGIDTTERVIEGRRRQVLRDLASRTAEARIEEEVWRVSGDTLAEHRQTIPFAFLYIYRPTERRAYLVGPSLQPDVLDPSVVDCTRQNLWEFDNALVRERIVVELGGRASVLPSTSWPVPPEKAAVVPIRLREESDAAGFLVLGIHPGRAFDEACSQFVARIAEQIAIGLASARAYEHERRRAEALAEIDRAKTAFFSNVSHEFRTPLQLMLGPLEEILREGDERVGPERHHQLLTVHRNALRLLTLVNTLLDFSRLEAGRVQAVYQPTNLARLTADIASVFRSAMENANLQFSVECQPIAEPVFVDRSMWEKIVLNLLSNAFKFTFKGEVAISLRLVNGAVELQVCDTGVGIPDDQRENVFARFHRIEHTSARTHEGTGIGLSLVQELVKLHGGSVEVKSTVGVGTAFTVTIPRGKAHLPAESIQPEQSVTPSDSRPEAYVEETRGWLPDASSVPVDVARHSTLPAIASPREAVLEAKREVIVLADDNADMRDYLGRLLGDRYEVHAVADGERALEAACQLRPALVLADVMMPRLDGLGLLRAIRSDSTLWSTPVILVSARAGEESRVEGLQADADDYLVKPFTSPELLARVATHVKLAQLRRVTEEREKRLHDLAERERESRMVVDTIPGLVGILSPSGDVEVMNHRMLEYFGRPLEEMKHWEENDTIHPEDLPNVIRVFAQAIASQEALEYEARLRRFDGVYRWFQLRGFPARDDTGRVGRWYFLVTDIDDLKRAEDALRGSERSFKLTIDTIPALAWSARSDGSAEFFNRHYLDYVGLSAEQAGGWGWMAAVHPDDVHALAATWQRLMTTGEAGDAEARLRRSDGAYRWFLVRANPLRDEHGTIVKWYGINTDIEDRKQAEAELKRAYDSFADAQGLSHTGSFITDLLGDDHNWSEEAFRIFDFEPGTKVSVQRIRDIIHPDDLPSFESVIARGMQGENVTFSFRIVTATGTVKHVRGVAHVVERVAGRPLFVGALQDVTESKVAEEALDRARSELAHVARVTAVSAFTASIAHEVNQPLSGIITNAGTCLRMLAADPPDVDGARETAKRTLRDGNRAADVITRLRALFSKREFTLEPLDINEIAQEVVALSFSDLQRNRVILRAEFAPNLPPVTGDRIQLQQVILNLVRNASDAMTSVDDRPRQLVIATEREADNRVRLTVRDAGVGLDAQSMNKLFDAFYTTKTNGMGIGLSVSRSIIERHHGRLWAEANDGPGATFAFAIPAAAETGASAIDTKV
jgi:PAS domain S-box-containing protein